MVATALQKVFLSNTQYAILLMSKLLKGSIVKHLTRLTVPSIGGMLAISLPRVFLFIMPLCLLGSRLFGYTDLVAGAAM